MRDDSLQPYALAVPLSPSQVEAASALRTWMPAWVAADAALDLLRSLSDDAGLGVVLLKVAALDRLYGTNMYAIVPMAQHIVTVLAARPEDPIALVEAIAVLRPPPQKGRTAAEAPPPPAWAKTYWSFASKFVHFFLDPDRVPLYDAWAAQSLNYHLGPIRLGSSNPYRQFVQKVSVLRSLAGLSCSIRELDRYLWLSGMYREWSRKPDRAPLSREVISLFTEQSPEVQRLLSVLVPPAP